jgi:hypothetical protein
MLLTPFVYKASDGSHYFVEAQVTYHPALNFNKHTAASRDDILDELIVDDILVIDVQGKDVTEEVHVPDQVLIREIELQYQDNEDIMCEGLTMKHIADDVDWYKEEMFNV